MDCSFPNSGATGISGICRGHPIRKITFCSNQSFRLGIRVAPPALMSAPAQTVTPAINAFAAGWFKSQAAGSPNKVGRRFLTRTRHFNHVLRLNPKIPCTGTDIFSFMPGGNLSVSTRRSAEPLERMPARQAGDGQGGQAGESFNRIVFRRPSGFSERLKVRRPRGPMDARA